jgi:hypothetical protein
VLHSSRPPVAADANTHRQPIPSRLAAASPAAPTAATASANGLPDGSRRTNPASSHNAQRHRSCDRKPALRGRSANRVNHPRNVERGTPTAATMRRCPKPAAPHGLQRPTDQLHPVTAADQHRGRQQHMRDLTTAATPPPRTHPLPSSSTTHRSLSSPTPRAKLPAVARRTRQRARLQIGLDADRVTAYRRHGCAYRSKRPSRCPPRLAGRASHVQGPTDPAPHPPARQTTAPPSPPPLTLYAPVVLISRGV